MEGDNNKIHKQYFAGQIVRQAYVTSLYVLVEVHCEVVLAGQCNQPLR